MRIAPLAAIIELLAVYHPSGIRVLLGQSPALTPAEWEDLVESIRPSGENVHVQCSSSPEDRVLSQIEIGGAVPRIIEEIGGWDMVLSAVKTFRVAYPHEWWAFARYGTIKTAPCTFETVADLAKEIHMSRTTLWRMRHRIPEYLAHMVISGKIDLILDLA